MARVRCTRVRENEREKEEGERERRERQRERTDISRAFNEAEKDGEGREGARPRVRIKEPQIR